MPLVDVNKLSRRYGDRTAVDGISFSLDKGDILGLLGSNGAGKSTTMKMLCGVLAPSEGEIRIDGIDLLDEPRRAKRRLGYLPEQPPLYRDMTVDEYLRYCARLHGIERGRVDDAMATARRRCGLDEVAPRLIGNLSKGYQQRVGIAQAIIHSPPIIVLDEPTVGLDPIQIREIRELIIELGERHGIILSTHILPEVQAVCNRVLIINDGRLVHESRMGDIADEQRYQVRFHDQVALDALHALDCVSDAAASADGFEITLNTASDAFVAAAVTAGWRLAELSPARYSLEQVFVALAHQDANSGSEAA